MSRGVFTLPLGERGVPVAWDRPSSVLALREVLDIAMVDTREGVQRRAGAVLVAMCAEPLRGSLERLSVALGYEWLRVGDALLSALLAQGQIASPDALDAAVVDCIDWLTADMRRNAETLAGAPRGQGQTSSPGPSPAARLPLPASEDSGAVPDTTPGLTYKGLSYPEWHAIARMRSSTIRAPIQARWRAAAAAYDAGEIAAWLASGDPDAADFAYAAPDAVGPPDAAQEG